MKNSMTIFSVIDIIMGAMSMILLLQEVLWDWRNFNINGPHYMLTLFYFMRVIGLPIGMIGFIAISNSSLLMAKCYFNMKTVEMALIPFIGILSSGNMCNSYLYTDPCNKIYLLNTALNVGRFCYLFYAAYLAKSYYRRLERGEKILVNYGKSIVELINSIQSSQRKNDIELSSVHGISMDTNETNE